MGKLALMRMISGIIALISVYLTIDFQTESKAFPEDLNPPSSFSRSMGASPLYFSHVDSGNTWETEICVINAGNEQSLSGELKAYDNTGQEVSNLPEITLVPLGRREIIVGNEFANPSRIRYIVFETDSPDILGYTKFFVEGKYRVAIPAVKEVGSSDIYVPHIASTQSWWTGISLLNTTSSARELIIQFDNQDTKTITLGANQHAAFTIKSLFGETPGEEINSAVIKNSNGVIGLELFGSTTESGDNYLGGVLLKDYTAVTLYYPHMVNNSSWWTGIVAHNPSTSPCDLTVTPYNGGGTSLSPQSLRINGNGKYIGTMAALGLSADTAWLKIEASHPVCGLELFGTNNRNQLAGYTAISNAGKQGIFAKLEKDGWTGIALINTEDDLATVTLTAYDDSGNSMATTSLTLEGNAKKVKFAKDLFTESIDHATYVSYSSNRAMAGFQLNGSSDGMLLDALSVMDKNGETDDFGDSCSNAFLLDINSITGGNIETGGDYDYFQVELTTPGTLTVYTIGITDTSGYLKNSDCSTIRDDDDGGSDYNFRICSYQSAGVYYVAVKHYDQNNTGSYTLHVEFEECDGVAVLIGVSDYQDNAVNPDGGEPYIPDLTYADDDAIAMGDLLQENGWHVVVLIDSAATKSAIQEAIRGKVGNASSFFFYFSGHGVASGARGYICPYDSLHYSYRNDISENELENWLLSGGDGVEIGIVLDTCHSGSFIGRGAKPDEKGEEVHYKFTTKIAGIYGEPVLNLVFGRDLTKNQWVVLTACRGDEEAMEGSAWRHGWLTYKLLNVLVSENYDNNQNSAISIEEAYLGVGSRYNQHPQLYDGNSGSNDFDVTILQ